MNLETPCVLCGTLAVSPAPVPTMRIMGLAMACQHAITEWFPIMDADTLQQITVPLTLILSREFTLLMQAAERSDDPMHYTPHTNRSLYMGETGQVVELRVRDRSTVHIMWDRCPMNADLYHGSLDVIDWTLSEFMRITEMEHPGSE